MQPLRAEGRRLGSGSPQAAGLDKTELARAQEAYNEILGRMGAMIDAIMRDPALTHDQKLAAVASLRAVKLAEAKAVRARMIAEAKAKRRKSGKRSWPKPTPY